MYSRVPVPAERHAAIWPIIEPEAPGSGDGPLAVVTAALAAARRHKFKFGLWVLACIAVAAAYAYTAAPSYTSTATLLLEPRRQAIQITQDQLVASGFDVSRAESELQVLRSERLLANVFNGLDLAEHPEFAPRPPSLPRRLLDELGSVINGLLGLPPAAPMSREDLRQQKFEAFEHNVNVRRVGQSYVAEFSYTAKDPILTRKVANAAASAYLWQSISVKADAAKNGAEFLQGRLTGLSTQARAALAGVAEGALPAAPTPDADARVIGEALQPLRPSAPRKGLILSLGAMIGLVGGFLGVALSQALDRRIRTPQDVLQHTGLPCLASLPQADRRERSPRCQMSAPAAGGSFTKGIRELYASVQLAAAGTGRSGEITIALIACAPGTGTSLIALHLARLMRGERPVTLVDGNVHGTTPWPSLGSDASTGDCLADLLGDSRRMPQAHVVEAPGIALIPARSRNPEANAKAYLGTPALQQVIERLRQHGSVILDLPPLSVAPDARIAAKRADVVVLVALAGQTTSGQLIDAATTLRAVGANLTGVVINRI